MKNAAWKITIAGTGDLDEAHGHAIAVVESLRAAGHENVHASVEGACLVVPNLTAARTQDRVTLPE